MVDTKTYLEGLEISDEVKNQIAEKLNPIIAKFESDVSDAAGKLEDAIKTRQKAKDELKELRTKFAEGDFDGKKEMKSLIDAKENEVISLTETKTKLETELSVKNTELEAIQTETKLQLKDRFTDVEWEEVKTWAIKDLRVAAKLKSDNEAKGDRSRRFSTFNSNSNDSPKTMSEWRDKNKDKLS